MMRPRLPGALSLALAAALLSAAAVLAGPPPTETRPATDDLHGVKLMDPYRWLEGSDAPEIAAPDPALDARVAAWTDAQNAYSRRILDGLTGRDLLAERLAELEEVGTIEAPTVRGGGAGGDLYFYRERRGEQAQAVLYVRRGLEGESRVLVDPVEVDASGLTTLAWYEPSRDGKLLAFGLYRGGDELATLYLLRVADGEWLAEEISGKVRGVFWLPDGSAFFYRRLAEVENPYSAQIRFHRVGRHHRHDPVVFEQYKEGPLATTWGPVALTDHEARWLALMYHTGTDSNDLWVYDVERFVATGELEEIEIVRGENATFTPLVIGDALYLHTTLDAPNGRVVAVDPARPAREHWREILPERDKAVLEGVSHARGRLAAHYLVDAATRIELFDLEGRPLGAVDLPGLGSARLTTEPERDEAFLTFQSFHQPASIYRVDLGSGERTLWARPEVPVDPTLFTVRQVFYASKDGTQVPMFLVYRKDLELDGGNPTILSGYGGFSVSQTPRFSSRNVPWLEAGGVIAVANLRGGGEYGEAWHRSGMLERKQNVFDDFIAAAEWLVASRYTDVAHLGVAGGSNGGLLTGAALVQRPDLFSAVFCAVPLLDMLRYQYFLMARFWVPEYGSAEDPEHLKFLLEYSPYQNVKEGVKYPAVFLTAGENDVRVHPLHARKMAARLQAASANDPDREPILLWVERESGHGGGRPLALRLRDAVDQLAFMAWQLGLELVPAVSMAETAEGS